MKLDPSAINSKLIEELIMRCYTIDHEIKVNDSGKAWARLKYGVYSYHSYNKDFEGRVSVGYLQKNFSRLIFKHKNFTYKGFRYYYDRGKWWVS